MNNKGNGMKPLLTIPTVASEEVQFHIPRKLNVYEFYTISDGQSRIYKEEDGINDLGKQVILDPGKVSYMNLFINGVLQPKESYEVQRGAIILKTTDVPTEGAPLILQMIKL